MKKEFERLDELVKNKTYQTLTEEERTWVDEMLGQERYEELYGLVSGLKVETKRPVRPAVKRDLVQAFEQKHHAYSWYELKMPAWSTVPLAMVLIVLTWLLLPAKEVIVERQQLVNVPVIDTVTVQLPADTIYIERKVRVEVPVYLTKVVEVPVAPKKVESKGKSLAEEQELQGLLVRGE